MCKDAPREEWRVYTKNREAVKKERRQGTPERASRGRRVQSGAEVNYYFAHGSKRRLGARFSFSPALVLLALTAALAALFHQPSSPYSAYRLHTSHWRVLKHAQLSRLLRPGCGEHSTLGDWNPGPRFDLLTPRRPGPLHIPPSSTVCLHQAATWQRIAQEPHGLSRSPALCQYVHDCISATETSAGNADTNTLSIQVSQQEAQGLSINIDKG